MKKLIFCHSLALVVSVFIATTVVAAPHSVTGSSPKHPGVSRLAKADSGKQKVTIDVLGVENAQSPAIVKALADNGITAKAHDGKGKSKPMNLTADIDPGADLSQWTKIVAAAIPKGQPAPTLQIVVFATITKETGTTALAHLEKLKGVDAKRSIADVKNGELCIVLTGNDHVTANDISTAVQTAGVTGHFAKTIAGKKS